MQRKTFNVLPINLQKNGKENKGPTSLYVHRIALRHRRNIKEVTITEGNWADRRWGAHDTHFPHFLLLECHTMHTYPLFRTLSDHRFPMPRVTLCDTLLSVLYNSLLAQGSSSWTPLQREPLFTASCHTHPVPFLVFSEFPPIHFKSCQAFNSRSRDAHCSPCPHWSLPPQDPGPLPRFSHTCLARTRMPFPMHLWLHSA